MISSDMRDQKIEKKRKQIEQQEKWIEHQLTYDIKKKQHVFWIGTEVQWAVKKMRNKNQMILEG